MKHLFHLLKKFFNACKKGPINVCVQNVKFRGLSKHFSHSSTICVELIIRLDGWSDPLRAQKHVVLSRDKKQRYAVQYLPRGVYFLINLLGENHIVYNVTRALPATNIDALTQGQPMVIIESAASIDCINCLRSTWAWQRFAEIHVKKVSFHVKLSTWYVHKSRAI